MVHHEMWAPAPAVPKLQVKQVTKNPVDDIPAEPDGTPPDPFRAGADPEVIALRKIEHDLSKSDVEKIALEGGSEVDHAQAIPPIKEAPQPSLAPEAVEGDQMDPYERLKKSELVDFVNFGYDRILGDP